MGKHYVPQEYLGGFATPTNPKLVWMYDKQVREWRRPAIKKVAQQADYFDDATERHLSSVVEHAGHRALKRLRAQPAMTPSDRAALALYAATMIMRVPTRRRQGAEIAIASLESTISRVRQVLETTTNDATRSARQHELEVVAAKYRGMTAAQLVALVQRPWPSDQMVQAVSDMTWRIIVAPAPATFLTTDNPAYFFEAFGLARSEAELTFPLASHIALLGSWQGDRGATLVLVGKPAVVKEINRRVASGAERFLFHHRRAEWVATLGTRAKPYLSRIFWQD